MSAKISLSIASSALEDLKEIQRFYAQQQVPAVGKRLVTEIISHIETLSIHPDLGRVVPEFDVKNLRELIRPPFRIVYRRDKNRVRIVRVWRSERLLKLP